MKTEDQLQEAHDMLMHVLEERMEVGGRISKGEQANIDIIHACHDVLCWVLEHKHNTAFEKNLKIIRKHLGPPIGQTFAE